jgi:hypothetical protein
MRHVEDRVVAKGSTPKWPLVEFRSWPTQARRRLVPAAQADVPSPLRNCGQPRLARGPAPAANSLVHLFPKNTTKPNEFPSQKEGLGLPVESENCGFA